MRNFTKNNVLAIVSCAVLLFAACGDDSKNAGGSVEDQEIIAISDKTVTGVSQKGPFVNGSSVTVQELNGETLAQTGLGFEGKIKNDMGEFSVKVNKLESQYALLKANGFYRNEVTGEKSKSQVTLYALTDLSKRDEVNVNLLTHLSYERSLYLATEEESVSVTDAKKQAETEVLKSFEIEGDFGDAEDLNIFGESDQSAALLAVSVLMQGNLSEGDFSERLANYAADIESDGVWNDTKTATQIADWAITQSMSGGLALIRNNIAGWKLSTGVPAFEKYVDNFWWWNYGLGTCDKEREGEVKKNQNAASVYADKYFICRSNLWYEATALEYDTYEWKDGKDGDVKYGDVVKESCYVFEDSSWRTGDKKDCSLKLRGCTKLRQDTVGLGEDKVWYICDAQAWRNATDIEKDTATWGAGKNDGEIRKGQINKDSYYIYDADKKIWRNATTLEKDTYDYTNNRDWLAGTDGEIKQGSVTDSVYVFDSTVWRSASKIEKVLGGCVVTIADSIGKVGETYYKCTPRKWIVATELQYDTYKQECSEYGQIAHGSVNAEYLYFCYGEEWKRFYGNENVVYGKLIDERDGQIYRTVKIGGQTWMAENLNYADSTNYPSMLGRNWCVECDIYGRYYSWSATIDSVYWSKKGNVCGYLYSEDDSEITSVCNLPDTVQGICPEGWHVPNENEWKTLAEVVDGNPKKILAKGMWENTKATDELGMSLLPAGFYSSRASNDHSIALFWSSTDASHWEAVEFYVFRYEAHVNTNDLRKTAGKSIRCIKDEEE
jgi:uncharacterized protein (TIGR02145 family)